ncbi:MAG: hypothetical protein QOJ91_2452 [Sphingomonadales bacterium]|jgi:hypothetical protein|nr:hypothetical protein [Sphingomonadales bacterium]
MKMTMIAALAAAQLSTAGWAQSAEPLRKELPAEQGSTARKDFADGQTGIREGVGANLADGKTAAAREDRPRKRKSTGDKVLTGAAVILGVGALAVGGLLIALVAS